MSIQRVNWKATNDYTKAALDTALDALSLTQNVRMGSWAKVWQVYLTGHQMNAIREVLNLDPDPETK